MVNPPKFNEKKPLARAAESNSWTDEVKSRCMVTFLTDSPFDWLVTVAKRKYGDQPPWSDLRAGFICHYLGDANKQSPRRELDRTSQRENESGTMFIPRVLRLIQLLEPDKPENDLVDVIGDRLRGIYQEKLSLNYIYTIESLNDAYLRIGAGIIAAKNAAKRENIESRREVTNKKPSNKQERLSSQNKIKTRSKSNNQTNSNIPRKCYRCGRENHLEKDCKAKSKVVGSPCNE